MARFYCWVQVLPHPNRTRAYNSIMRLLQNAGKRLADVVSGGEVTRLGDERHALYAYLKESSREIERLKEDVGWLRIGESQGTQDRQKVRNVCRYEFQRGNPFVKGAIKLMTEFCFEQGVDGPASDDKKIQDALTTFWSAPDNQESLFATVAQHRASNQLLVDGDYFIMVRTGGEVGKHTAVRYMPASYVIDIITDPLDVTRVLYYKCAVPSLKWDSETDSQKPSDDRKVVFYRDIYNIDEKNDALFTYLGARAEKDAFLQHITVNAIEAADFGWPEPAVSLPWFQMHKETAQDQATTSKATAALMTILKVDASSSAIDTLRDELRDRGQYADGEANENVTAQINLMNQQAELSVNRASSRAGEAEANSRMFRMAGDVGVGLPLHYQGDPDNAGLATARTMDRPTLVHMRAYQSVWIDAYRKLFDFVLLRANIKPPYQYDIPAPRIARQDISEAGPFIIDAYDHGLLTRGQASSSSLDILGFDDIAREQEALEEEMEAEEAEPTVLEEEQAAESGW